MIVVVLPYFILHTGTRVTFENICVIWQYLFFCGSVPSDWWAFSHVFLTLPPEVDFILYLHPLLYFLKLGLGIQSVCLVQDHIAYRVVELGFKFSPDSKLMLLILRYTSLHNKDGPSPKQSDGTVLLKTSLFAPPLPPEHILCPINVFLLFCFQRCSCSLPGRSALLLQPRCPSFSSPRRW